MQENTIFLIPLSILEQVILSLKMVGGINHEVYEAQAKELEDLTLYSNQYKYYSMYLQQQEGRYDHQ